MDKAEIKLARRRLRARRWYADRKSKVGRTEPYYPSKPLSTVRQRIIEVRFAVGKGPSQGRVAIITLECGHVIRESKSRYNQTTTARRCWLCQHKGVSPRRPSP